MLSDRRRTPRFAFAASSEVWETDPQLRVTARVSDISLFGCYLDMTGPLPIGSKVMVRIFAQSNVFESPATVVYSHRNLGMGIKFHDTKPEYVELLKQWLELAANQ